MSAVETRTFRADDLDSVLGAVREELGPDALVLRQREGIVGGIGGFFGKRCVEVDVEVPASTSPRPAPAAMPARALSDAYAASPGARFADSFGDEEPGDGSFDDEGDLFRELLDNTSVFAATLQNAIEEDAPALATSVQPEAGPGLELETESQTEIGPEAAFSPLLPAEVVEPVVPATTPAPALPEASLALAARTSVDEIRSALCSAGLEPRLVDNVIVEADTQLRIFDPAEPFANQVRQVFASRISTRRPTGRFRRRVIALVGNPGSGKTSVAARLCEAHLAAGKRVVLLSLEPVRKVIELGRQTEGLELDLIAADQPALVDFALDRLARAEVVVVDTPGIETGDDGAWSRLAVLLGPVAPHETHLLVPGTADGTAIDGLLGAVSERLKVNRLLLTHLGGPAGTGPGISASLRLNIPISATATSTRLRPADPYELARTLLS